MQRVEVICALSNTVWGYTIEAGMCIDGGTVLSAGACTGTYQNKSHVTVKTLLVPGMVT
jgi:hypothetical protein